MFRHEAEFHIDSFAKQAAAFFRISRSILNLTVYCVCLRLAGWLAGEFASVRNSLADNQTAQLHHVTLTLAGRIAPQTLRNAPLPQQG